MIGLGTSNALWWSTPGFVTITRPQIIAGLPKWKPSVPYVLRTASAETLPFSKDVLAKLTLEQRELQIWVFIAEMTVELMAWLDVLWAYGTAVYLKHLMLGQDEMFGIPEHDDRHPSLCRTATRGYQLVTQWWLCCWRVTCWWLTAGRNQVSIFSPRNVHQAWWSYLSGSWM
jgi:hypothetical protein